MLILILTATCFAEDRRFTVWDSIAMTRFSIPFTRDPLGKARVSPDGRHFAVVTSRGLRSNRIESTIWLFDTDTVRAFLQNQSTASTPQPMRLATYSAVPQVLYLDSYSSIVSEIRWSPDSRSVYCLAQNLRGEHQLYRVSLTDGFKRELSPRGYSVHSFDVTHSGVVYTASRTGERTIDSHYRGSALNADATALTDLPVSIGDILFPQNRTNYRFFFTWVRHAGSALRIRSSGPTIDDYRSHPFAVSPNGKLLVELLPVKEIPSRWSLYRMPGATENLHVEDPQMVSPFNMNHMVRYSLIDLTTRRVTPLIDGPSASTLGSADIAGAKWSADGTHILITSTFVPQNTLGTLDRSDSIIPCAAAVVDIRTRVAQCVTPSRFNPKLGPNASEPSAELIDARFGENDHQVLLSFLEKGATNAERYEFLKGHWMPASADEVLENVPSGTSGETGSANGISLWVRQDLNSPPALWATDKRSGSRGEIWNPNPQLHGVKMGNVSVYHWKDSGGYEWAGGLVKPVDYVEGQRYPLVIQTHGFQPDEFLSDGSYTTAMAALPLASAGIMVLQVPDRREHAGTMQEASDHVVSFEAAIDKLVSEGLVDPARVGLIGFSRTCYYVLSALIRDPSRYAAATVADGADGSYMEHRLYRAHMGTWDIGIYGGAPNGPGLRSWVDAAPDFHLDAVGAALRIEAIGPASLLGEWELYSALREQEKPVDLVYIRGGQHILQKPLDRIASQQGNVDWFRFWLTDQMSSPQEVPDLNRRWLQLRELANRRHSGSANPM